MIDGGKVFGYCEVDGVQLASCYYLDSTGELDYDGVGETEDDYTYEGDDAPCWAAATPSTWRSSGSPSSTTSARAT